MEIKGTLIQVLPEESGINKTGNRWAKQSAIIETIETYSRKICITFFGDRIEKLSVIPIGATVTAHVNIESREFNGKWFTNIDCWKINADVGTKPIQSNEEFIDELASSFNPDTESDNMPF